MYYFEKPVLFVLVFLKENVGFFPLRFDEVSVLSLIKSLNCPDSVARSYVQCRYTSMHVGIVRL